ncbi:hypothetical protein DSL72_003507 [Monilinia vaccinii-corymbosi]|uniref:Uncharacterized protein n=1 Tax=Monilinia vaccinii-corymbosi TaxID=61207 RepID=A0A8A3P606_9HELO|nr:hypothetical protein DSL72_003507 [Monilinia vaccinii-corymbosi]
MIPTSIGMRFFFASDADGVFVEVANSLECLCVELFNVLMDMTETDTELEMSLVPDVVVEASTFPTFAGLPISPVLVLMLPVLTLIPMLLLGYLVAT